jgi:ribonuclease R
VTVRLVEAAPVAGALRFELLSEGRVTGGSRRREPRKSGAASGDAPKAGAPTRTGNHKRHKRSKRR